MKSIYYITYSSITDYLAYGLQIETCLKNQLNVRIIDISKVFNFSTPTYPECYKNIVTTLNTFEELEQMIKDIGSQDAIFNIQLMYEWRFRKIFRMMARLKHRRFSIFLLGQLPFNRSRPAWEKIFQVSISKIPFKIISWILSKLFFKLGIYKNHNIIFYAGESLANAFKNTRKYPINYFDYDRFLENKNSSDGGYAVFLDDGLFQHPDDEILGNVRDEKTLRSYQQTIGRYFDFLETEMGLKTIIAGHPRIKYSENSFGAREIRRNNSRELVQNAHLVFCHFSSSLSYAVCYSKPLFFLTDNNLIEFSRNHQPLNEYIHNFAFKLGRPVINISDDHKLISSNLLAIDSSKYEAFTTNYLTTKETIDSLSKEKFIGYLNKEFES
jgi:hypothetical protein